MKDRIRQLMESQHLSQQSFADVLQISPASLSSIFNDRTKPTLNHVDAIKKKFPRINLDWLLYGNEPMFLDSPSDDSTTGSTPTNTTIPSSGMEQMLAFDSPSTPSPAVDRRENPQQQQNNYQQPLNNHRKVEYPEVKYIDKPQRQIAEIRIFFDDQTWETFVPKK